MFTSVHMQYGAVKDLACADLGLSHLDSDLYKKGTGIFHSTGQSKGRLLGFGT